METNEKEIIARWNKKKDRIALLQDNIRRLRVNVALDLKSENEKIALTALVVNICDLTSERIGNSFSATNHHYGVTGFKKKHVKINGNQVTFEYTGKSGVEHNKVITNERLAKYLKQAIQNSPTDDIFVTSSGFKISNDRVNRYLKDFNITAKDLRGFYANDLLLKRLHDIDVIEDTEYKRKKQMVRHMKFVAEKLGHGAGTLRKHYILPEIPQYFVEKGKIADIDKLPKYEAGGLLTDRVTEKKPIVKPKNYWSPFELLFGFDF